MEANKTLLQMKFSRVVAMFAQQQGLSVEKALEIFYHSETYRELSEGIAELHCRSDQYIVDELKAECSNDKSAEISSLCKKNP
ncbi:MAG: DUF3791 domain-containing protein [Victivallales bacterium]|nr:DUF3791 domain-containing protein [Victivallales bacterium]